MIIECYTPYMSGDGSRGVRLIRDMPDRSRIIAELEIRTPGSALSPGFSFAGGFAGELYKPHGSWWVQHKNERDPDASGQIHDELLRAFPKLAPFARVHLCDLDGTPMHARENATFWYKQTVAEGDPYVVEYAARTLNINADQIPLALDAQGVRNMIESCREGWRYDVADALAVFDYYYRMANI